MTPRSINIYEREKYGSKSHDPEFTDGVKHLHPGKRIGLVLKNKFTTLAKKIT